MTSPVDNQTVFECKYELDSLAGFLKASRSYYAYTKDTSFMNDNCKCFRNLLSLLFPFVFLFFFFLVASSEPINAI